LKLFKWMDKIMFFHLNRRGIETSYWVLNSEKDFERALKSKVDGIETDCPSKLIKYLKH